MIDEIIDSIPGYSELVQWFGCWPSFHDAEILNVSLDRSAPSSVRVHTFRSTTEIDEKGYFVLDHHVVVTFWFQDIIDIDMNGFNTQNVISGLDLERTESGYRVTFAPCYGLAGVIESKHIRVTFNPGKP